MNLCIDIGNTRIKAAIFKDDSVIWKGSGESIAQIIDQFEFDSIKKVGVSSVTSAGSIPSEILGLPTLTVNHSVALPIKLTYKTPETLGADRICAAVGGHHAFPNSNVLTIDIGTCVKYELISKQGEHLGGNISPGIHLRYKSLHDQTAALPLIKVDKRTSEVGLSTEQAIRNGVQLGILCELEAMIERMSALHPNLKVVLTGGDLHHFENDLKTPIFAHPLLVLEGLNEILHFYHPN